MNSTLREDQEAGTERGLTLQRVEKEIRSPVVVVAVPSFIPPIAVLGGDMFQTSNLMCYESH